MRIVHFCSYYVGSNIYLKLFSYLNKYFKQSVYVPIRNEAHRDNKGLNKVNFFFVKNLNVFTRFFYFLKVISIILPALKYYNKKSYLQIIHAHTLYSDGIPAYLFGKIYNVPLVITIRGTDVSLGFKYYFHYKWLAIRALRYSKKIVFVSPSHLDKFRIYFGSNYDAKLIVIPNGIDKFYLKNILNGPVKKTTKKTALYVGSIDKNKNLKSTIKAFFIANHSCSSEFRIIGGTYLEYTSVYGVLPKDLVEKVVFLGRLPKEQVLIEMRLASIFIMVSHSETFGLVYVEAISQCTPIVYSSGQGVDGYFYDGEFGYRAKSDSVNSISQAISKTLVDFPDGLGPFVKNPAMDFSWGSIAGIYKEKVYK